MAGAHQMVTGSVSSWLNTTAASRWASCLTAEQRRRVAATTVVRAVPKGGSVCCKTEPVKHWVGVVAGQVNAATVSAAGKVTTFSRVGVGGWFGEESLLKSEPGCYDAIAMRDSCIAYVPRPTFIWLLDNNVRFSRFVLEHVNERLAQAMGTIESGRLTRANGKLAKCLADLFSPTLYPGLETTLDISQEEIGHLAGLSRQCVNYALKALEEAGLVRVQYRRIAVLDVDGLRRFNG